jgi:hypothetical protein
MNDAAKGAGWVLFAGIMIFIAGTLNTIWGIAAIDKANFFVDNQQGSTHFIISNLSTWGWIVLIIGVMQLFAAFSIWAGNEYGRWIGILTASVSSIGSLLSIDAYPFWSLCVFAIDILVIYGLVAYGGQPERVAR